MMVHPAGADLDRDGRHRHPAARGRATTARPPTPPPFPHKGRNALDAAVLGYMNVAALRQHIRPTERIHGIFTDGRRQAQHRARPAAARVVRARRRRSTPLEPLKARVLACLEAGADGRRLRRWTHEWQDPAYADMLDNAAAGRPVRRQRRARSAATLAEPDGDAAGGRQHRHGQRQLPGAVDPPDDRGRRPPGVPIHTPEFAALRRRPTRATGPCSTAPRRMAMTVADLWLGAGVARRRRRPRSPPRWPGGRRRPGGPRSSRSPGPGLRIPSPRQTADDRLRRRGVHARRGRHPPALLHQPRRPGLRPGQPARGGEGRAVRPLLPLAQEPAAAVPRRVRRRPRHHRRRRPIDATVGLRRAEELYDRVFFEYGDDSVAQLGGVHLACEQASNLLTKVLEWGRLMAYLEQSTRYIAYDARIGGRYRYYRDPDVLGVGARHPLRRRHGPAVRHLRRAACPMLADFFRERFPKDAADSDFVYRQAIRAKAFDAAAGHPARGVAVQRRHLRHRPGLRAAPAAHAGPPAARGPRLRRPDARPSCAR